MCAFQRWLWFGLPLNLLDLASRVQRLDSGASSVKSTCWRLWCIWYSGQLQALDSEDSKAHPVVRVSDWYSHMCTWPPDLLTQVSDELTE